MLEVWEYVLNRTEKGDLVALDFLDISAGFDTMVHLYLLRKLEVQFGVAEELLAWLASYLEGWLQYTVVEDSSSAPRKMTKGAPQGGGLSPILWRSNTNDIPEAGLRRRDTLVERRDSEQDPREEQRIDEGLLSRIVDSKTSRTMEEKLDQEMRKEGAWDLVRWREERSGMFGGSSDRLKTKETEEAEDVLTTIYADDTQSRASAKTKEELERRNSRGLTKVCKELKALRLKVNEDKTTYMILATQGRRARENLESEIIVCEERVKSVNVGKALGLLVSSDLTWRDQVEKTVKSCQEYLNKYQRKMKAEGIIISRLRYCLEVVSTGRKVELEKLQGVQSAAARWVLQTRRRDWSLSGGLKKLAWLSVAQLAVYASLKLAIKILKERKPERLFEILTVEEGGEKVRRIITDRGLKKMKATTKKAWSVRVLRWLELIPAEIKEGDISKKPVREALKSWIKHTIPVRGDRVLWGQSLVGERRRRRAREERGPEEQGGGGAGTQDSQAEEEQEQAPGGRTGRGTGHEEQGAGSRGLPGSQAAVVLTSLHESRETSVTGSELQGELGRRNKYAAGVFVQGGCQVEGQADQGQEMLCRDGLVANLRRLKSMQGGTGPRGLPRSQTAVVRTSLKGRRETGTRRVQQQGERGEDKRVAADVLTQARLHEREAWLSVGRAGDGQCCVWKGKCCRGNGGMKRLISSGGLTQYQTKDILGWRKGVG